MNQIFSRSGLWVQQDTLALKGVRSFFDQPKRGDNIGNFSLHKGQFFWQRISIYFSPFVDFFPVSNTVDNKSTEFLPNEILLLKFVKTWSRIFYLIDHNGSLNAFLEI